MLKVDAEALATLSEAKAALEEHGTINASLDELMKSYTPAIAARNAAKEAIDKFERQLGRGDVGVAGQLAEVRAEAVRQEQKIAAIDEQLAQLATARQVNNHHLETAGVQIADTERRVRSAIRETLQAELEALAPGVAKVLTRMLACHNGLNWMFGDLPGKALLPAVDRFDRSLIEAGRLRIGGPDEKRVVNLDQAWREDPELAALHDQLSTLTATLRKSNEQRARIAREREEAIRADPEAWVAHQEEVRRRTASEEADRKRKVSEARARQEDEARKRIPFDTPTAGTYVREPGTPAPGQSQEQFDAAQENNRREVAERRARVAAEAERAEAALRSRATPAPADAPAAS